MPERPSFLAELRHRRVLPVAAVYAGAAWILIQVAATRWVEPIAPLLRSRVSDAGHDPVLRRVTGRETVAFRRRRVANPVPQPSGVAARERRDPP